MVAKILSFASSSDDRARLRGPVLLFAGSADTAVKAVGRVEFTVERHERGLCGIHMADIVLGRIFDPALGHMREQLFLQRGRIGPLAHQEIQMENMAEVFCK